MDVVKSTVQLRRLRPNAIVPRYQTRGAAGLDLHACLDQPLTLSPGVVVAVPTGFAMAIEDGHEGQVRPRSGLAARHAVTVANAPGTIDCDFRGEVMVLLINLGPQPFVIQHGERIAQLVIAPYVRVEPRVVDELDETERGSGGFGSTGR
jgi:dUTP pyrophosphatase